MSVVKNKIKTPTYEELIENINSSKNLKSKEQLIAEIKEHITQYEQKYKMISVEFASRYERGDFEMDDNFLDYELLDWSGSYKRYQRFLMEQ